MAGGRPENATASGRAIRVARGGSTQPPNRVARHQPDQPTPVVRALCSQLITLTPQSPGCAHGFNPNFCMPPPTASYSKGRDTHFLSPSPRTIQPTTIPVRFPCARHRTRISSGGGTVRRCGGRRRAGRDAPYAHCRSAVGGLGRRPFD